MGESQMHFAKWKEARFKRLCYSSYITFWKKQNSRDREQVNSCQTIRVVWRFDYKGQHEGTLGGGGTGGSDSNLHICQNS